MQYALIRAGIVVEMITIAEGTSLAERYHPDFAAACVIVPEGVAAAQGWTWDGEVFAPPPEAEPLPPAVPPSITRRQLLLALHAAGLITDAEALAAATSGAVPATLDNVFAQLPAADALAARITWATMSVAERAHPLIAMLVSAELATAAEVDAIFVDGASR